MSAYSIVGIPGWESLSLRAVDRTTCERRLGELAHGSVPEEVPRDRATPFRQEVRKHLERLVEQARSSGADLLCLPTQRMGDLAVPASYTVAEWLDSEERTNPEVLLGEMARRSEGVATLVQVDGQPALREDCVQTADPVEEPLATRAARRVSYTVLAPEQQHRWVLFTFSTLGDGDPAGELADVLVQLFDAQLTTLRWSES